MRVDNNLFGQAPRQIANIPRPKVVREADALAGVHFAIFAFFLTTVANAKVVAAK